MDWLEAEPQVSLAFEPGTLQIARGPAALARLFRRAELVARNREEAAALTGARPGDRAADLLDRMLDLGPAQVVVTDGSAGAFGTDGTSRFTVPVFPDDGAVVDRTGAGDAFAATLVAGLAGGLTLERAMARAPVNSIARGAAGGLPGRPARRRHPRTPAGRRTRGVRGPGARPRRLTSRVPGTGPSAPAPPLHPPSGRPRPIGTHRSCLRKSYVPLTHRLGTGGPMDP